MYNTVDGGLSDDICTCECGGGQEAQKQKPQKKQNSPKNDKKLPPGKQTKRLPQNDKNWQRCQKTGKCTDTHMQIPCKNCPKTAILQDIRAT